MLKANLPEVPNFLRHVKCHFKNYFSKERIVLKILNFDPCKTVIGVGFDEHLASIFYVKKSMLK